MRFLPFFWLAFALSGADYDLLIRNARLVDGTGNPWYRGDIGIRNGRIAAVGELSRASATRTVDAKERVAAPGFIDVHTRVEGEHVFEAIEEAIRVGREGGMRVELSHFKIDNKRLWGSSAKSIALVDKARRDGVDVVVDQYPYDRSSTNLGITLPSWALADGSLKVKERLADPATRGKIAKEMEASLKKLGHKDYSYAVVASCSSDRSVEGKSISEINRLRGRKKKVRDEIQTILDIESSGGAQMVYHSMGEKDVDRIMRYTNTGIASDGGVRVFGAGVPHPRSYGTNARVLAEFVRRRNVLTLEDAIRKMTSLPARTFGFRDRGQVREGYWADLVLFDPDRVQDKATFVKPHQFTEGFDLVLVNGQPVVEDGKVTGARPGRIVRNMSQ